MFANAKRKVILLIGGSILLGFVSFLWAADIEPVELTGIEVREQGGKTEARISLSARVEYREHRLTDPLRLVIEFAGEDIHRKDKEPLVINQGRIAEISGGYYADADTSEHGGGINPAPARRGWVNFLVFELADNSAYEITREGNTIIVDITDLPVLARERTMAIALAVAQTKLAPREAAKASPQIVETPLVAALLPKAVENNAVKQKQIETAKKGRTLTLPKATQKALASLAKEALPADTATAKQAVSASSAILQEIFPLTFLPLQGPILQALLIKGFTIAEGVMIFTSGFALFFGAGLFFYRRRRLRQRGRKIRDIDPIEERLEELSLLPSIEFKSLVLRLLDNIEATVRSVVPLKAVGDREIDMVHFADGHSSLIEYHKMRRTLDSNLIGDFYSLLIDKGIDKGYIVTTGIFSMPALDWAESKKIELISGKRLIKLIQALPEKQDLLVRDLHAKLEKRRFPRTEITPEESKAMRLDIKALYQESPQLSSKIEGRIRDIGPGGIMFEANRKIRTPTLLQLELSLSPLERLKVLGNPVWQKKEGSKHEVGAAFFLLSESDRSKISRYVEDRGLNKPLNALDDRARLEEKLRRLGQTQEALVRLLAEKGIIAEDNT